MTVETAQAAVPQNGAQAPMTPAQLEAMIEAEATASAADAKDAGGSPPDAPAETASATKAADEAPKEEPKEPPKAKEPERPGAKLRELQARERKLVERQDALRREREEHQRLASSLEAKQKAIDLAERDPLEFLKSRGITLEELGRRILNDGRATETEETKRLRAELDEQKRRIAAIETERQKREADASRVQAEKDFLSLVHGAEDRYPLISERYNDTDLVHEAWAVMRRAWDETYDERTGRGATYSDEEVLEFLEQREAAREAHRASRKSAGGSKQSAPGHPPGTKSTEKPPDKSPSGKQETVPTLSGRDAGTRASLPKDPLLMSEDEELAEIRRIRNEQSAAR